MKTRYYQEKHLVVICMVYSYTMFHTLLTKPFINFTTTVLVLVNMLFILCSAWDKVASQMGCRTIPKPSVANYAPLYYRKERNDNYCHNQRENLELKNHPRFCVLFHNDSVFVFLLFHNYRELTHLLHCHRDSSRRDGL